MLACLAPAPPTPPSLRLVVAAVPLLRVTCAVSGRMHGISTSATNNSGAATHRGEVAIIINCPKVVEHFQRAHQGLWSRWVHEVKVHLCTQQCTPTHKGGLA